MAKPDSLMMSLNLQFSKHRGTIITYLAIISDVTIFLLVFNLVDSNFIFHACENVNMIIELEFGCTVE